MKKIIALVLASCLMFSAVSFATAASDDSNNVFCYGEKEITVEGTDLSYDEMKAIADYIAGEENSDGISTHGLTCTIFGHKITESAVKEITHNVYNAAPKCVERLYSVKTCSRCDYIEKELLSSYRIHCH